MTPAYMQMSTCENTCMTFDALEPLAPSSSIGSRLPPKKNKNGKQSRNRRRQQLPRIDRQNVSAICTQLWRCTVTRASPAAPG